MTDNLIVRTTSIYEIREWAKERTIITCTWNDKKKECTMLMKRRYYRQKQSLARETVSKRWKNESNEKKKRDLK